MKSFMRHTSVTQQLCQSLRFTTPQPGRCVRHVKAMASRQKQEAELSQTGRAMFRVFFTQGHSRLLKQSIRKLVYGLLFAFHSNYGLIFSRFDTIHERDRRTERHQASHPATARRHRLRLSIASRGKSSYVNRPSTSWEVKVISNRMFDIRSQ